MMTEYSPYTAPNPQDPQLPTGGNGARPAVLTWFNVYLVLMILIYVMLIILGAFLFLFADEIADADMDAMEAKIMGMIYGGIGTVLGILFLIGAFIPRKKWGWIYGIVLICLGLTSCCTLPACIPLLIFWIKPEAKAYFNMSR